ncbi:hypothetical protein OK349_04410 [Sphingomonas sp. BT-65]|uniref:hypothetical protein n=1 Tax=Sphingomonas sp. BT-65 TaxID=2989821 RepID=UPI0022354AF1|nr:hypothetical protein [Sphingomonas sp. BT-65]MCW4460938.1 hypothetical protein [Sphingomonas sp. BT-65]
MREDREIPKRISTIGGVVLAVAIAAAAFWFFQWGAESGEKPATEGVVAVNAPAVPGIPPPSPAGAQARTTTVPVLPAKLVAHVRQAYPLLLDVDFGCDARGCAITATIPPPTGDEFLKKRQEMLVGGLAKLVEADGYEMLGPVQMDEVDDNLFQIRASVVEAQERAK